MKSKFIFIISVSLMSAFFGVAYLAAREDITEDQTKLNEIRLNKARITEEYKQELQKVNKAGDEKLAVIKKDFHAKRDECIMDTKDKQKELENDYKKKIEPLIEEERKILEVMAPTDTMNFAKPKVLREKR